jgi:hypothetical protein
MVRTQVSRGILCKQEVAGSIPAGSTGGSACKSVGFGRRVVFDWYSVRAESTACEYHIGPCFAEGPGIWRVAGRGLLVRAQYRPSSDLALESGIHALRLSGLVAIGRNPRRTGVSKAGSGHVASAPMWVSLRSMADWRVFGERLIAEMAFPISGAGATRAIPFSTSDSAFRLTLWR